MLPPGKYVVEVIVPPGYELVKEEDKNILLGDVYIAPVTQQFAGFGNIFIMPDQAAVERRLQPEQPGRPRQRPPTWASRRAHEGDTGSVEAFWPCVGAERIVPDFNSLFPGAGQDAPFAGAKRPLCDRKEVTLDDQTSVLAKFYVFSSTHVAAHFTGIITNDFASEFDPFSPQFGEKFGPPNLPVAFRDFNGNEVARVYSDQWGVYNGLYYSTYGVNPPNPTGYVPQMPIACMNDPGPIPEPDGARRPRPDDHRPGVQPGLQQLLLRVVDDAGHHRVHGHAGDPDAGLRRRLQPAGRRVPGRHAGDQDGGQLGGAGSVGPAGRRRGRGHRDHHLRRRERRRLGHLGRRPARRR